MTCLTCIDLSAQIKSTHSASELRDLCCRLIEHKLRDHARQRSRLPWADWPQLGICPHCIAERKN